MQTLADWLQWQQQFHPKTIDLGLKRIVGVARAMDLLKPATSISHPLSGPLNSDATVITVAGTNGKGSCLKTLEQCLMAQQKTVGVYTSPHLHHYCERICINGQPVSEVQVCQAFTAIENARGDISLSYFEFGTLAALWLFVQHQVDFVLLEVGLGGRLDAVNIVDADVMAITAIDIDHQQWLGNDRNSISQEKLGIARPSRPLIIAEKQLTPALEDAPNLYPVKQIDRDFYFDKSNQGNWQYREADWQITLPVPPLSPTSVAAGLAIVSHLKQLPDDDLLFRVIENLTLPGRFQTVTAQGKSVIFDVAHNTAAAQLLAERLLSQTRNSQTFSGVTLAVVAMLDDKQHQQILDALSPCVHAWYLGDLQNTPRALPAEKLAGLLKQEEQTERSSVFQANTIESAFASALSAAGEHDRIIVFGSFFTVAAIQAHLRLIDN